MPISDILDSDDPLNAAGKKLGELFKKVSSTAVRGKTEQDKAFFRAVESNKVERVAEMLRAGYVASTLTVEGLTALHVAARRGHAEMTRFLLAHGLSPMAGTRDDAGHLPVHEAMNAGKTEVMKILALANGWPRGRDEKGWTLFLHAVKRGLTPVVRCCLDMGVDPNEATRAGATALIVAIMSKQEEVADVLLDHPATLRGINTFYCTNDEDRRTAFHLAVDVGMANAVTKMLKAGALVNRADASGVSPLGAAIINGDSVSVKALVAAGADLAKPVGTTPLPLVQIAQIDDITITHERIFSLLLAAGADPLAHDPVTGTTALHASARHVDGDSLLSKCLQQISATADTPAAVAAAVTRRDARGDTPLHAAAGTEGSTHGIEALVKAGADINARHGVDGSTPLMAAARAGNWGALRVLLRHGARASLRDAAGKTALSYARAFMAANHKDAQVIKLLEETVEKELHFKHKPSSSVN